MCTGDTRERTVEKQGVKNKRRSHGNTVHWDYVCSKSNVWNRNSIVLLLKITRFLPENVFQAAMIKEGTKTNNVENTQKRQQICKWSYT